jgi:hypothetical protein
MIISFWLLAIGFAYSTWCCLRGLVSTSNHKQDELDSLADEHRIRIADFDARLMADTKTSLDRYPHPHNCYCKFCFDIEEEARRQRW